MKNHLKIKIAVAITLVSLIAFGFQNCAGYKAATFGSVSESASVGGTGFNFSPDCMTNSQPGACLFYKNPDGSTQTLQAEMPSLLAPIALQSQKIVVTSANYGLAQAPWRYPLTGDASQTIGQVMTYFWAQHAIDYAQDVSGEIWIPASGLSIVTDANVTGWDSGAKTIYLGRNSTSNTALDSSIVVHLVAEANIYYAMGANLYDAAGDSEHVDCGVTGGPIYQRECCRTNKGCMRAISAGSGDHLQSMIFENSPGFANYYAQTGPLSICGIKRDPRLNAGLTAALAYSACSNQGVNGQAYAMGAMYASIWWEVRRQGGVIPEEIDRLFFNHIKKLSKTATFVEALAAIQAADMELFGGKYSSFFTAEFNRRGI